MTKSNLLFLIILITTFGCSKSGTTTGPSSSISVDGKNYSNLTIWKGGIASQMQLLVSDKTGSFVNAEIDFDFGANYPTVSGSSKIGKNVKIDVLVGYGGGSGVFYGLGGDTTKSITYNIVGGKINKLNLPTIWVYNKNRTGGKDSVQISATDIIEP